MQINDAIQIIKPDPDSHFRLKPCGCTSDNVAYVEYSVDNGSLWGVRCFDCDRELRRPEGVNRHGIQVLWNGGGGCYGQ